ncbi:fluoride efflux transporter CrcB [bacterium]|nr:fluoride efflux transporter CrcB [bacterium]
MTQHKFFILISIAMGGALGAVMRYIVSGLAYKLISSAFPWGTLAVNLMGCFLLGFIWQIAQEIMISPYLKTFITIGLLGAFTTFSTYAIETVFLLQEAEFFLLSVNILISTLGGIAFAFSGLLTASFIINLIR